MREDMHKVIVERPRRGKYGDDRAAKRRNDPEGPTFLGMRAGYGYRSLNENLAPLRRYLRAQVGRPWNKVFSEICAGIDGRNAVQQHIRQHIDDLIATKVEQRDRDLVDLHNRWRFYGRTAALHQELYVDPRSGLIRTNKRYLAWREYQIENAKRAQKENEACRRILADDTQLHCLDGIWFHVSVGELPADCTREVFVKGRRVVRTIREKRFDAILRRDVRRMDEHSAKREHIYGAQNRYGISKRQLSKRELDRYGLR